MGSALTHNALSLTYESAVLLKIIPKHLGTSLGPGNTPWSINMSSLEKVRAVLAKGNGTRDCQKLQ